MAKSSYIKWLRTVSAGCMVAATMGLAVIYPQLLLRSFRVAVLDVGQGDSILITTPDNINILVDGGPGNGVLQALGSELPFFDKRIDLVISTHPDADHLEGLIPVLQNYEVGAVIRTGVSKDTAVYETFLKVVEAKDIYDARASAGDRIRLGKDTVFTIIWPPPEYSHPEANETSIVGRLSYKEHSFLLTADISDDTEEAIVAMVKPEYIHSSVLKVAHHGSRSSTAQLFLDQAKPQIALISLGADNRYGHPAADVLERLKSIGAQVLRTDHNGTIEVTADDRGLFVSPKY